MVYYVPGRPVVLEVGYNFKASPFWEGYLFNSNKREGVKFYDTVTVVQEVLKLDPVNNGKFLAGAS